MFKKCAILTFFRQLIFFLQGQWTIMIFFFTPFKQVFDSRFHGLWNLIMQKPCVCHGLLCFCHVHCCSTMVFCLFVFCLLYSFMFFFYFYHGFCFVHKHFAFIYIQVLLLSCLLNNKYMQCPLKAFLLWAHILRHKNYSISFYMLYTTKWILTYLLPDRGMTGFGFCMKSWGLSMFSWMLIMERLGVSHAPVDQWFHMLCICCAGICCLFSLPPLPWSPWLLGFLKLVFQTFWVKI